MTINDILAAAERLKGHHVLTPMIESTILNDRVNARVFLKAECLQRTGSFKFRGAYNALSNLDLPTGARVLAASSGNHAQGVAEAARLLGYRATILMPSDAPAIKKDRTIRAGAEIIEYDRFGEDRETLIAQLGEEMNAPVIHPYETPDVIAGQGTAGLEASQYLCEKGLICDRALVCAGGGGLMSGTLLSMSHYFSDIAVHPVEPEGFDDQRRSLELGRIVGGSNNRPSICDAILTPKPGELAFSIGKDKLSPGLLVTDEEALDAVAFAFQELKLVVEPGGAVALAALLSEKVDVTGEVVVATLSGGNVDANVFSTALSSN